MRYIVGLLLLLTGQQIFCQAPTHITASSWEETLANKRGDITIFWHTSRPFILPDEEGNLTGIEYDILMGFVDFLKEEYEVDVNIHWVETPTFSQVLNWIEDLEKPGIFGASAISKTSYRRNLFQYSPSYISDISVIISTDDIPIVNNENQFDKAFDQLTAITIKNTTYENDLMELKQQRNLHFKTKHIHSSKNILQVLQETDRSFAYIDLPIYLIEFNKNPNMPINRQNFFAVQREGYGIIYPNHSDWHEPMLAYFKDEKSEERIQGILENYMNFDIYNFIESQYSNDLSLLNKEKEIQNKQLTDQVSQLEKETFVRNLLLAFLVIILLFMVTLFLLYSRSRNKSKKLAVQQSQILRQSQSISEQKDQLEKRNELLISLNSEKNNLIKILAHDLRTPINHIKGLASLLLIENKELSSDHKKMINTILDSSTRLTDMISKILDVDAIEENRINISNEKVDITKVVKKVCALFKDDAARKNISLASDIPNDKVIVSGDPLYLTEVVENLLSNAIKFTFPEKSVKVETSVTNGHVLISFYDEGPGISEEDENKLFKKFQKLSATPTGGEQTTGLGLSIVKRYVELMNGKVWSENRKTNDGAVFHVQFPVAS